MRKKTSLKDIAVIGLALFAMFFGAGNLIFPPYLGTNAGSEWFIGFYVLLYRGRWSGSGCHPLHD